MALYLYGQYLHAPLQMPLDVRRALQRVGVAGARSNRLDWIALCLWLGQARSGSMTREDVTNARGLLQSHETFVCLLDAQDTFMRHLHSLRMHAARLPMPLPSMPHARRGAHASAPQPDARRWGVPSPLNGFIQAGAQATGFAAQAYENHVQRPAFQRPVIRSAQGASAFVGVGAASGGNFRRRSAALAVQLAAGAAVNWAKTKPFRDT